MNWAHEQENDVERAANLNREHWDYCLEEMWRWLIASRLVTLAHAAFQFLLHDLLSLNRS